MTAHAPQSITIAIPLDAIGPVTVTAPPPRLVWSDSDDAIIAIATGMVRERFVDLLRVMERDPEHGRHVLQVSRKHRGVEVDAFINFLRARYAARPAPAAAAQEHDDDGVAAVCAELGLEDVPRAPAPRRRARAKACGT